MASSTCSRPSRAIPRFLAIGFCVLLLAAIAPVRAVDAALTSDRADAAAGWLARQLVGGDHFEAVFGDTAYPDQGLTIDAVLGFAAAGSSGAAAAAAVDWLGQSANASGYIGDGAVESYAGATAKLALLAQVAGHDPTVFGEDSLDLIARLQAREQPNGHFMDLSLWGDYSNSIGQSLAIIVLARQPGVSPSAASLDFLRLSQCSDGGFDLALDPAPLACTSGADTTAFAVQALLAAGSSDGVAAGLDYLAGIQQASGGVPTSTGGTPNANSTGLAAQALAAGGRAADAADARAYLETLQQGCEAAEANRGAIAYDASGFDAGNAARATAQALLALGGTALVDLTLSGANAEADELDCRQATTTTSTTSSTATSTTTAESTTSTTTAPPAAPLSTTPRYTG